MKSIRRHGLGVAGLLLSMTYTVWATDSPLTATVLYDVKASCTGKVAPAVSVAAVFDTDPATCADSVVCNIVDDMFPATYCPTTDGTAISKTSGDFYYSFLGEMFGSASWVSVETYEASGSCAAAKLSGITAYLADGQCHKTGATGSYIAISDTYGSAVKTFSAKDDCTGAFTTVAATSDELDANSCADNLVDKKMYYSGNTTVNMSALASYDSKDGDCQPTAVPTKVASDVVDASCESALTCSGEAVPYTSTVCSTSIELLQFLSQSYGTDVPFILLREFADSQGCAATDLTGWTVYLADKKCHQTDTSESFRATRTIDGAVTIKTFASGDCSGTASPDLTWDAAKATGNACADGATGIADTLVFGHAATPLYLELTATFSQDTDKCVSPGIPIMLVSTIVDVDVCDASNDCTAAGDLFTGTICSSTLNVQSDVAAAFGDMPFVTVETFGAGKSCATAELDTITVYLADGKCHKTGDSASVIATRAESGAITVAKYTDAACTPAKKDNDASVTATANQATVNSCTDTDDGILDTLVYGGGFTPLYLQSTATFESGDDSCVSPAKPTYLDTAVVDSTTCEASGACTTSGDLFTGTLCSSTATFKDDAATAFDSTPFIVVGTYATDSSCATTSLSSSKSYAADAKCHAISADASFLATRSSSGDMVVTLYSDSTCTAGGEPLKVGADGAGLCSSDQIVYGAGETPTVLSTVLSYDDNACSKPAQLIVTNEFVCSESTECTETDSHYLQHGCSEDYLAAAASMFGNSPYVVVELYKEDECTTLDGVQVYSSDKDCHVAIDGTSFTSTLSDTGDGDLVHYSDGKCAATGEDKTTTPLDVGMLVAHTCTEKAKYYAFNGPMPPGPGSNNPSGPNDPNTPNTPDTTTKTPATPTTTTATPSSTTEAPTTTSTGSGKSDAASLFQTSTLLTASLGLFATVLGLL